MIIVIINKFNLFIAQPLGVPEISRKSLSECEVTGGEDLFILGKNFHKDPIVIFQEFDLNESKPKWIKKVHPDKESLQPVSKFIFF